MSDQHEPVVAAVYGALLDDENEGLDPFDLAVKIAGAVLAELGRPTTWTERNEGLSDGHSESYRAGWRMGRAVRDE